MSSRKRGRRTGTYPTAGQTQKLHGGVAGGSGSNPTPAALATADAGNLNEVIVDLRAEVQAFAEEVRELRAVVRHLGGTLPRAPLAESTQDLDLEGFRQGRRRRLAFLGGVAAVPLCSLLLWALWPERPLPPPTPAQAAKALATAPTSAARPAPLPPPAPSRVVELPAAPPNGAVADGKRPMPSRKATAPPAASPPVAAVRRPSEPPPPVLTGSLRVGRPSSAMAHETSGGAPILD